MSATNKMAASTVRIECSAGKRNMVGTSFFCSFPLKKFGEVPVLITNRHVVEGFNKIRIFLPTESNIWKGTPARTRALCFDQIEQIVYYHDNPNIDLAAILLRPILDKNVNDGSSIYLKDITLNEIIADENEMQLRFVEDVLVVGYPQGMWDHTRNLPLFRRGVTASPAMLDYNGESKFLIDCAIYPGSSGSPVFLYSFPTYVESGEFKIGEHYALLGVVSAFVNHNVEGRVEEIAISTAGKITKSNIPSNLGVVIKAREILALAEVISRQGMPPSFS